MLVMLNLTKNTNYSRKYNSNTRYSPADLTAMSHSVHFGKKTPKNPEEIAKTARNLKTLLTTILNKFTCSAPAEIKKPISNKKPLQKTQYNPLKSNDAIDLSDTLIRRHSIEKETKISNKY